MEADAGGSPTSAVQAKARPGQTTTFDVLESEASAVAVTSSAAASASDDDDMAEIRVDHGA